jgi:hypothetical protein
VHLHDALHERKPDAEPCPVRRNLNEQIEDSLQVLGVDAFARILERDGGGVAGLANRDGDSSARRRVPNAVRQRVPNTCDKRTASPNSKTG